MNNFDQSLPADDAGFKSNRPHSSRHHRERAHDKSYAPIDSPTAGLAAGQRLAEEILRADRVTAALKKKAREAAELSEDNRVLRLENAALRDMQGRDSIGGRP